MKKSIKKLNLKLTAKEFLLKAYLLILCLPYLAMARDFLSSVENASNEIRQIIAVVWSVGFNGCGSVFLLVKETWDRKVILSYYWNGGFCDSLNSFHSLL